jgi:hypothetical protein
MSRLRADRGHLPELTRTAFYRDDFFPTLQCTVETSALLSWELKMLVRHPQLNSTALRSSDYHGHVGTDRRPFVYL